MVALRAGGPMLKLAFLDQGKEEEASGHAWRPPRVSGAKAWPQSAARPHPARWRSGLRHCSESNTAPTAVRPAALFCCHPGCGTSCTPPWWPWSESSAWPEYHCPVPCGSPATEANLGTGSLEKGSMAPVVGSCFQKCLHRNLEGQEMELVCGIPVGVSCHFFCTSSCESEKAQDTGQEKKWQTLSDCGHSFCGSFKYRGLDSDRSAIKQDSIVLVTHWCFRKGPVYVAMDMSLLSSICNANETHIRKSFHASTMSVKAVGINELNLKCPLWCQKIMKTAATVYGPVSPLWEKTG